MGKSPCPRCIESVVYCTQGGAYYHSIPDCSGMKGASAMTVAKAVDMGKNACPICVESWVFCTQGGVCFHKESDCSGMEDASLITIAEALSMGKSPCPSCFLKAVLASTVFTDSGAPGGTYHSVPDCSGQSFGRALTMEQALAEGCEACPDCAWNPLTLSESAAVPEASVWDSLVYYTPGGV